MSPSLLAALVAAILAATWILRRRVPVPSALLFRGSPAPGTVGPAVALVAAPGPGAQAVPPASGTGIAATETTASATVASETTASETVASETVAVLAALARLPSPRRGQALRRLAQGDPAQRLLAVQAAGCWGHRQVLPLLRQALRDPQPAVVRAAVLALEPFRAGPALVAPLLASQLSRLPGNAAPRRTSRRR